MKFLTIKLSALFFTLLFSSPLSLLAQTSCPSPYDGNDDGSITINDLLDLLGIFGADDLDSDGVWDTVDLCVDMSACNYSINPSELCIYLDVIGVCGGDCTGDSDGDGICDDVDTCDGVIDVCGVCAGSGSEVAIIESITIIYDSLYASQIDEWLIFEVGADTLFSYPCLTTCVNSLTHEGYNYSIVQIGNQCWFAENCRYLPSVSPSSTLSGSVPNYYVFGYEGTDVNTAKSTSNYLTYGVLYNFEAAVSPGVCPVGWHVPNEIEWQKMEMFLGMNEAVASNTGWRGTDQGTQMKSATGWNNNGSGTNSSGFSGIPGGYLSNTGIFYYIGNYSFWWSSTSVGGTHAWSRGLYFANPNVYRFYELASNGFSVRCVMD